MRFLTHPLMQPFTGMGSSYDDLRRPPRPHPGRDAARVDIRDGRTGRNVAALDVDPLGVPPEYDVTGAHSRSPHARVITDAMARTERTARIGGWGWRGR